MRITIIIQTSDIWTRHICLETSRPGKIIFLHQHKAHILQVYFLWLFLFLCICMGQFRSKTSTHFFSYLILYFVYFILTQLYYLVYSFYLYFLKCLLCLKRRIECYVKHFPLRKYFCLWFLHLFIMEGRSTPSCSVGVRSVCLDAAAGYNAFSAAFACSRNFFFFFNHYTSESYYCIASTLKHSCVWLHIKPSSSLSAHRHVSEDHLVNIEMWNSNI